MALRHNDLEGVSLREACGDDRAAILALNRADVAHLGPLHQQGYEELAAEADLVWIGERAARPIGFIIAVREATIYDSGNYRWFAERYDRFLYIDRIVVSPAERGRGLGRALYERVFARAARDGVGVVTCEYSLDPANEPSAKFHAALGFSEIGRRRSGPRLVSLQSASAIRVRKPG